MAFQRDILIFVSVPRCVVACLVWFLLLCGCLFGVVLPSLCSYSGPVVLFVLSLRWAVVPCCLCSGFCWAAQAEKVQKLHFWARLCVCGVCRWLEYSFKIGAIVLYGRRNKLRSLFSEEAKSSVLFDCSGSPCDPLPFVV